MKKNEVLRPIAMIALMFSLLLGLTVVSFSRPAVLDDVTAAGYAQRYVPRDSVLNGVADEGSDYVATFSREDAGMDISYKLTVNKASQEITNVRMEVNDGGNIVVSNTDSNVSRWPARPSAQKNGNPTIFCRIPVFCMPKPAEAPPSNLAGHLFHRFRGLPQRIAFLRNLLNQIGLLDVDLRELGDLLVQRMNRIANLGQNIRDLLRRIRTVLRQLADLFGDDGKAASLLAGAGRFDGRVEAQHIRLRRNALDEFNHLIRFRDFVGCVGGKLLETLAAVCQRYGFLRNHAKRRGQCLRSLRQLLCRFVHGPLMFQQLMNGHRPDDLPVFLQWDADRHIRHAVYFFFHLHHHAALLVHSHGHRRSRLDRFADHDLRSDLLNRVGCDPFFPV